MACHKRRGFAPDHCGDGFGDVIAFTRKTYGQRAGRFVMTHADVVLNAQLCWDAYAGPLRLCQGTLGYAIDLHRVVLHELAHSIGFSGGQLPSYVEGSSSL